MKGIILAGIRYIFIITPPHSQEEFQWLLGDGASFGIGVSCNIRKDPNSHAELFIIGEGSLLALKSTVEKSNAKGGAAKFEYLVKDLERYGVVEFDENQKITFLAEKPAHPKSPSTASRLYFYDNNVETMAKQVTLSHRGELETISLNNVYLEKYTLDVHLLDREFAGFDSGARESLLETSSFIQTIEGQQNLKVARLEEIGFNL